MANEPVPDGAETPHLRRATPETGGPRLPEPPPELFEPGPREAPAPAPPDEPATGSEPEPAVPEPGAAPAPLPTPGPDRTLHTAAHRGAGQVPVLRRGYRAITSWARRPGSRLAIPGVVLAALVAVAGTAGAYLVPALARNNPAAVTSPPEPGSTAPGVTPTSGAPVGPTGVPTAGVPGRPADVLIEWADRMSAKVGVPPIAMQAYGYAELVLTQTQPACQLKWTTLAAIGMVESNHGRANNASLLGDGRALPPIVGDPLDGQGGRAEIRDTDRGALDGDATWDRAVGPMQFIPRTWNDQAIDADNDGARDPHDIDDASLAAANYLCRGGRNMSVIADWWAAILTYNDVRPYAQAVYEAANDYGTRSHT